MRTNSAPVHLIVAHGLVELLDVLGELLGLLHQEVDINLIPEGGIPVREGEHDSTDHVPQCLEISQLLLHSLFVGPIADTMERAISL